MGGFIFVDVNLSNLGDAARIAQHLLVELYAVAPRQVVDELLVVGNDDELKLSELGLSDGDVREGRGQAFDILPETGSAHLRKIGRAKYVGTDLLC